MDLQAVKSRKRKAPIMAESRANPLSASFPLDELNQDLLERVLSRLPCSSFSRLRSVCKRWTSVAASPTFRIACSEIPSREPWYLMVDQDLDRLIVFDTSEGNWKSLNHPKPFLKLIPVASSGGLVCFQSSAGDFIVCNPVTGACRELPSAGLADDTQNLHAISMSSSPNHFFRIVLVYGEFSSLAVKVFDSRRGRWEDEAMPLREADNSPESDVSGDDTVYFLSKAGVVVAANAQRSPSKQYSSVLTLENGEEVVYFLSHSGTVIACNLNRKTFFEYPRLLPVYFEHSIDVVECKGEMLVVILSEFLDTASLRVWKFCDKERQWRQVAVMPPAMSHEFFGKRADINCMGCGDMIFICFSSGKLSSNVMCDVVRNEWVELPKCYVSGKAKEFMSAFSFEPRAEAAV